MNELALVIGKVIINLGAIIVGAIIGFKLTQIINCIRIRRQKNKESRK